MPHPVTSGDTPAGESSGEGRLARLLRISAPLVVAAWMVLTGAAVMLVPPITTGGGSGIAATLNKSSPAVRVEMESYKRFDFPLLAQSVVVQHRDGGLSPRAQLAAAAGAVQLDLHQLPGLDAIAAAIPVTNQDNIVPSSSQSGTTVLTYLLFKPSVGPTLSTRLSEEYAHRYLGHKDYGLVGVTGTFPAENAQGRALTNSLSLVERISIGLLLVVVGLTFRSVIAPLLALLSAVMAYELSERLLTLATTHIGITVPSELDPIIVVLLLGIMTDYSVFYLSAFRRQLQRGTPSRQAVPAGAREVTPIVLVAGVTVATGVALISTAHLNLFRELAPGLAITVVVGVVVAVTFIPACLSILRTFALWPAGAPARPARLRLNVQRLITRRWLAPVMVLVGIGVLVFASLPVGGIRIGINLIDDLPASNQVHRAADAAAAGFSPGVVAPTEILVSGHGVDNVPALDRLQAKISAEPGVAGVIGPANKLTDLHLGVFVTPNGPTARFLVILDHPPFGTAAIADLRRVESAMPAMLTAAGLPGAVAQYAGGTAVSAGIAKPAFSDLLLVAGLVIMADIVLMAAFLRSLVAPLVLVAASALVVSSAFGITMIAFPSSAASAGFTFYVPFAAEVLLLSFGTDYNLFLTGEIWRGSSPRPFRDVVAEGGARAAAAINVAGLTLALSFAVLAVVPLRSFQELALAMAVGLLVDTFFVRFLIVPALLSLLGNKAGWPRRVQPTTGEGPDQALDEEDETAAKGQ